MECTLNRFTLLPTASDAANFQAASGYTSCQLSPSGNSGAAIGGESEPVPVTCTDFYCHVVGVGPIAWLRAVQYTSLTWLSVSGEVQTSPPMRLYYYLCRSQRTSLSMRNLHHLLLWLLKLKKPASTIRLWLTLWLGIALVSYVTFKLS